MKPFRFLDISLMQMQIFVKAAEFSNFAQAAKELHLAPSMVSKRIAIMEQETGLYLFVRNKNGVVLTPAGRVLYSTWKDIFKVIESSFEEAHHEQTVAGNILTFGLGVSVNPKKFFIPLIQAFRATVGECEEKVEVRTGFDLIRELLAEFFDVIFMPLFMLDTVRRHGELDYSLVVECPLYAGMLPGNKLADKPALSISDLKTSLFIMPSLLEMPEYNDMIVSLCADGGFSPKIRCYVNNDISVCLNTSTETDVFIADEYFHDFGDDAFAYKELQDTKSGILMVWKKESKDAVRNFVEFAQNYFNSTS